MQDDDAPMYGKWPFPEVTAENNQKLKKLAREQLSFSRAEPGWWTCQQFPELRIELGDYPDDPMYFFWDSQNCLGYADGTPFNWSVEGVSEERVLTGMRILLGGLIFLGVVIWWINR